MRTLIADNLKKLFLEGKLQDSVVLWGIGRQTSELLQYLKQLQVKVSLIVDNFKYTFLDEYEGIPVRKPDILFGKEDHSPVVLLAVNYADAIRKQLNAYGITKIYNLRNLEEHEDLQKCDLEYHFINRSKEKENLCYVLAGYEQSLWESTLARVEAFQSDAVDYCLVSSGKYDEKLDRMAEHNDWSYLYTEKNQVCFIQNRVVELHPFARYVIKLDEDMFIGKDFFELMLDGFKKIEEEGDYRVGYAVPVIPLNCSGYVSYLNLIGKRKEYEAQFGRAYKSRFSAVFSLEETAEFLWDTIVNFDSMAEQFTQNRGWEVCDCYFNIGCIMFTRERWLMMGKWPENPESSGMGMDEAYIYQDNVEKDMSIYEIRNVLAGHLAFGHQKNRMMQYYLNHKDKFLIHKDEN